MSQLPDFDTANLAAAVEALPEEQLDDLPFGVVQLDTNGLVTVHNKVRTVESGRGGMPTVGLSFFKDIAPCMDNGYFKGRIDKARAAGAYDISFEFIGDFGDRERELAVRAQPASNGGTWIFIRSVND